jgi:hypothetical protein
VIQHTASAVDIENDVTLHLFSSVNILSELNEGYRIPIQSHNEHTDKNKHVLGKVKNCIKICGTQEPPLRRNGESEATYKYGIFLDLVSEMKTLDNVSINIFAVLLCQKTPKTIKN